MLRKKKIEMMVKRSELRERRRKKKRKLIKIQMKRRLMMKMVS